MAHAPYFSGVQMVPGLGYIEVPATPAAAAALGDDASVMMISGAPRGLGEVGPAPAQEQGLTDKLKAPITLLGIELPLYIWLLIGAGLLGAGWFFFVRSKR